MSIQLVTGGKYGYFLGPPSAPPPDAYSQLTPAPYRYLYGALGEYKCSPGRPSQPKDAPDGTAASGHDLANPPFATPSLDFNNNS